MRDKSGMGFICIVFVNFEFQIIVDRKLQNKSIVDHKSRIYHRLNLTFITLQNREQVNSAVAKRASQFSRATNSLAANFSHLNEEEVRTPTENVIIVQSLNDVLITSLAGDA